MLRAAAVGFAIICASAPLAAERSPAARAEFQRQNPCPINAAPRGPCPGWIADHVTPLCAGGADHPSNMQWITREQAREKDPADIRLCAALRRASQKQ